MKSHSDIAPVADGASHYDRTLQGRIEPLPTSRNIAQLHSLIADATGRSPMASRDLPGAETIVRVRASASLFASGQQAPEWLCAAGAATTPPQRAVDSLVNRSAGASPEDVFHSAPFAAPSGAAELLLAPTPQPTELFIPSAESLDLGGGSIAPP